MTPPRDGIARRIVCLAASVLALLAVLVALMSVLGHALPSAQIIAYATHHNGTRAIFVMDIGVLQRVQLASTSDSSNDLFWSPDGQQIAYFSGDDARVDLYSKRLDASPVQQLTDTVNYKDKLSWSPDGQQMAFHRTMPASPDQAIEFLDVTTGSLTEVAGITPYLLPRWSPDGHWIAASAIRDRKLQLVVYPAGDWSGEPAAAHDAGILPPTLAWSPDSRWLIYSQAGPELNDGFVLYALDVGAGQQRILADEPGAIVSAAWSPDAHRLAMLSISSANTWTIALLDVSCLQTDTPCNRSFVTLVDDVNSRWLSWSPDSQWLLYDHYAFNSGYAVTTLNVACADHPTSCKSRAVTLVQGADSPVWQPSAP